MPPTQRLAGLAQPDLATVASIARYPKRNVQLRQGARILTRHDGEPKEALSRGRTQVVVGASGRRQENAVARIPRDGRRSGGAGGTPAADGIGIPADSARRSRQSRPEDGGTGAGFVKATQRAQRQALVAPVDGAVQQLSVNTVGGGVTPAQSLMVVVPAESGLEIAAMVSNQDIGFVHVGDDVQIRSTPLISCSMGSSTAPC